MNQAIDAWSFRQGNNLPISYHSPKYRTQPLNFMGIKEEYRLKVHIIKVTFLTGLSVCNDLLELSDVVDTEEVLVRR